MAVNIARRKFIAALGGAAAAWPLAARAQQAGLPVIGLLSFKAPGDSPQFEAAILQGLKDTDFVEGHVVIEFRFAGNQQNERLPALASDLAQRRRLLSRYSWGAKGTMEHRRGNGVGFTPA